MDERSGFANQTAETQAIDRKSMFGELLQIDGSFDYWFGREKLKACLINLIDDATSFNMCCFDEV